MPAVGIATPAVLTANLAEGGNGFISSVVLQVSLAVWARFAHPQGLWAAGLAQVPLEVGPSGAGAKLLD